MIGELAERDPAEPVHADVCVIGGGAAGLALAAELIGSGRHVTVLESGGLTRSETADELDETLVAGTPHAGSRDGRARVFGGATTLWGGQLLPLRQSETSPRPWVAHSGWPLDPAELEPFYRRVEHLLGVEGPPYDSRTWARLGTGPPQLDARAFTYRFSQWAPLTRRNLGLLLHRRLQTAPNVHVWLGATVVDIVTNPAGTRVEYLVVRSTGGRSFRVEARTFVLCCGAIETPRLMLGARDGRGVANGSDLVGRFFQDHLSYVAAEISAQARPVLRRLFEPRYRAGTMYTCKVEPTDDLMAEHQLLNVMAHVKFEIADALGLLEVRRMLREIQRGRMPIPSLRAFLAMARGGSELARLLLARVLFARRAAPGHGRLLLLIDVEQAPNPDSRIRLATETDRYGLPKAIVDWRLTGQELTTIERFAARLATDWQQRGLGTLKLAPRPDFALRGDTLGAARDIFHHLGTARMSDSPGTGVVDRDLRCHEVDNLFVAGGAVFPTSGIANPTFTILALTLRLADHLKRLPATPA